MYLKIQKRLQSLQCEYEAGQKLLADYETKQRTLRETLLRISGAIQVLEEELADVEAEKSQEKQTIDIHAETQPQGGLASAGKGE